MEYEFFNAEGAEVKFLDANTAIRSRSMTNALSVRPNNEEALLAASTNTRSRSATGLRHRLRLQPTSHAFKESLRQSLRLSHRLR